MKILLVNNFNEKLLIGGVENYLVELTNYNKTINSEIEFYWYGKDSKKTNWLQKFYNSATTKEIKTIIDDFKPDIIHCFSIGAPVTPHFMKYAKQKNIPILYSFRDYYYICPKNYMLTCDGKVIEEHKNGITCILNHYPKHNIVFDTLLYLKQNYHKQILKKYIHLFITPSSRLTQSIANHLHLKGQTLPNPTMLHNNNAVLSEDFILFVGRLDKEKGVLTLLKAFQEIIKKFPYEKLVIAGNGKQLEELQNFKQLHNLQNVTFVGDKNRNELTELYAKAKFVVIPSEILESYGNVVLESFAFKKTVIASDLIGIKNEIEDNHTGLIFPFGNIKKLSESIEMLLTNHKLKSALEENAFNFSQQHLMKNHFRKLTNIYESLLC